MGVVENQASVPKCWISSIQGLRAISFIAIFISHSNLGPFGCLGAWGVSVFLVMSGFLMSYQYLQKEEVPSFGIRFAYKKMRSLYPLHIITMIAKLPISIFAVLKGSLSVTALIVAVILNIGVVQIWIPYKDMYSALNGPSWFLCVISLSYFMFPLILKVLKRIDTKVHAFLFSIIFMSGHVLASFVAAHVMAVTGDADMAQWITYYFPPVRFCDFAIGCILGWLFLHNGAKRWEKRFLFHIVIQICCVMLIAASLYLYSGAIGFFGSPYIRFSLLFLPTTCVLIWSVASCSGYLEHLWSSDIMSRIAMLSPYAFLIHAVVLRYTIKLASLVMPGLSIVFPVLLSFFITIVFSDYCKKNLARR